jgi:hypothetical protein
MEDVQEDELETPEL